MSGASVVYAGRGRDVRTPAGALVLTDWDVLPVRLAPKLDQAELLTVLDPMSFPFDALRRQDREIPIAVQTPRGWGPDALMELLGEAVFRHLSPLDRVSVPSDGNWAALRARYSWPLGIRLPEGDVIDWAGRWQAELGDQSPRRLKSVFRQLAGPVRPQLLAARDAIAKGERERVVVLADDIELWASLFRVAPTHLIGIDPRKRHVLRARRSFPEWSFEPELPDGHAEAVHTALSVLSLCGMGHRRRAARLRALLRALRVGGRLIVVDRFLDGRAAQATGGPTPRALMAEIQEAAGRHLVLEHVEALRLSGENLTSIGVLAFTKLGRPERL